MTAQSETPFMTLQEVANLLGVSEPTALKLAITGELPGYIRLGWQHRFKRSAILSWLDRAGEQQCR